MTEVDADADGDGDAFRGISTHRITSAEGRVLEQLRQGRSNAEIAKALGLAVRTVKFHMRNLFKKFGVKSRAQLLLLLFLAETAETKGSKPCL